MSPAFHPLRTRIGEAIEQSLFRRTDPVPPPRSSGAVTLRADGITVTRGGRPVLEDVSVDVRIGEVLVLVGPNGAGKSTLLAALSGDQDVHSGTVHLDDRNLGGWTALEMAQRRAVLPSRTRSDSRSPHVR